MPVQIHLSETEDEVDGCLDQHGERPAFYLDRVGLLGPRTVLAHGCWLDRAELELIAERGATVVTNPVANLKLAVGARLPLRRRARRPGSRSALGTDGARLEQLARPARRREDVRPAAEERGARPGGGDRGGGAGESRPGVARGCSAADGLERRRPGRLPARAPGRPGARARRRSTPASSTRPTPPRLRRPSSAGGSSTARASSATARRSSPGPASAPRACSAEPPSRGLRGRRRRRGGGSARGRSRARGRAPRG